jgi:hypothetical protein
LRKSKKKKGKKEEWWLVGEAVLRKERRERERERERGFDDVFSSSFFLLHLI